MGKKQLTKIDYKQVGEVLELIRELRKMGVQPKPYQIANPRGKRLCSKTKW